MKVIYFFVIALILGSCSSSSEKIESVKSDLDTTNSEVIIKEEPSTNETNLAVQENPLSIEDFPKVWLMLDKIEDEHVINEYCEAETKTLRIIKEDEQWFIHVIFGQDGQKFKIIEFDAYEEERENFQIMYGSFILENPDYPDMDVEMYDYTWNKELMFCTFNGFFQDEAMMVSEENKNNYKIIKEDCDYLNDI
jgi:hypothetical protein